jgi:hypothetical protein
MRWRVTELLPVEELIVITEGRDSPAAATHGRTAELPLKGVDRIHDVPNLVFLLGFGSFAEFSPYWAASMLSSATRARQRRFLIRPTWTIRSSLGRCAPSRHQTEGHPQVLIIAQWSSPVVPTGLSRRWIRRCDAVSGEYVTPAGTVPL